MASDDAGARAAIQRSFVGTGVPDGLQLMPDLGVALRSFANDRKQIEEGKIRPDPNVVGRTQSRVLDTVKVFAKDDRGERQLGLTLNGFQGFSSPSANAERAFVSKISATGPLQSARIPVQEYD